MIDLGFEPQIKTILEAMPSFVVTGDDDASVDLDGDTIYRQTYMFGARGGNGGQRTCATRLLDVGDQGSKGRIVHGGRIDAREQRSPSAAAGPL